MASNSITALGLATSSASLSILASLNRLFPDYLPRVRHHVREECPTQTEGDKYMGSRRLMLFCFRVFIYFYCVLFHQRFEIANVKSTLYIIGLKIDPVVCLPMYNIGDMRLQKGRHPYLSLNRCTVASLSAG